MSLKDRSYYVESSSMISSPLNKYENQIGGHGIRIKNSHKFMDNGSDIVYKPVQDFPLGENEIIFYQKIFDDNNKNPVVTELKNFIPKFLGLFSYNDPLEKKLYIGMEDLLFQFKCPTVADIKLGQRIFLPDVSNEKKQIKINKYKWRESVGFLIVGMKVYESDYIFLDYAHGLKLDSEEVYHKGIKLFLGSDSTKAKILAEKFINNLRDLLNWFKSQSEMAFIASSLLIAYEGNDFKSVVNNQIEANGIYVGNVLVKLIDFVHVIPVCDHDHNCIYGIESLIHYFGRIKNDNNY